VLINSTHGVGDLRHWMCRGGPVEAVGVRQRLADCRPSLAANKARADFLANAITLGDHAEPDSSQVRAARSVRTAPHCRRANAQTYTLKQEVPAYYSVEYRFAVEFCPRCRPTVPRWTPMLQVSLADEL